MKGVVDPTVVLLLWSFDANLDAVVFLFNEWMRMIIGVDQYNGALMENLWSIGVR